MTNEWIAPWKSEIIHNCSQMLSIFAKKNDLKKSVTRKAKFYVILLRFGQVKFCPGKLTRVFQFCLSNPNFVPVSPRLPTLMLNLVAVVFSLSENPFIWSDLRSKLVCVSPLKGKWYRFRILCGLLLIYIVVVHLAFNFFFSFEVKT